MIPEHMHTYDPQYDVIQLTLKDGTVRQMRVLCEESSPAEDSRAGDAEIRQLSLWSQPGTTQ